MPRANAAPSSTLALGGGAWHDGKQWPGSRHPGMGLATNFTNETNRGKIIRKIRVIRGRDNMIQVRIGREFHE